MAGTPTLPTNREESGTHGKTPEKAAPPAASRFGSIAFYVWWRSIEEKA